MDKLFHVYSNTLLASFIMLNKFLVMHNNSFIIDIIYLALAITPIFEVKLKKQVRAKILYQLVCIRLCLVHSP